MQAVSTTPIIAPAQKEIMLKSRHIFGPPVPCLSDIIYGCMAGIQRKNRIAHIAIDHIIMEIGISSFYVYAPAAKRARFQFMHGCSPVKI
jgi:hypothetical protein